MLTQTPAAQVPQHQPRTCLLHGLSFSWGLADKAHRGWDLAAGDKPREGVVARGEAQRQNVLGQESGHTGAMRVQRGFPLRKCFSDRALGRTSGKD